MASTVLLLSVILALVLGIRALFSRSWILMWLAAICSLVASILGAYAIGSLIFGLTCVLLCVVIAQRCYATWAGCAGAAALGLLIWLLIVPLQKAGLHWLGGYTNYPFVGMAGVVLVALPIVTPRGPPVDSA